MAKDSDFWSGLSLIVFALFGFYESSQIPHLKSQALSAAFFPNFLFGILVLCGCGLIYQVWRRPEKAHFPKFHWDKLMPLFVLLLAYAFILEYLGFIVTTLGFMVGAMFMLGERKPLLLAAVPVVSTLGIYFLFSKVFLIVLP
jgi:putative tricarboxylic transport membrane protein